MIVDLFQSNLSLHTNNNRSEPFLNNSGNNGKTEYSQAFTEKQFIGKLAPLKRPPNLKVDACEYLFNNSS